MGSPLESLDGVGLFPSKDDKFVAKSDYYKSRRRVKNEKVKKWCSLRVLGKDVTMDMVLAMSTKALLGKFEFIKLS